MKRLTDEKEANRRRTIYEKGLAKGYPIDVGEERYLRLAAYEDTGLEPTQIADIQVVKMAEQADEQLLALIETKYGTPVGVLMGVIEALRDSRIIVLPCKVGDTVYAIRPGCEVCPFATEYCDDKETEFCGKNVVRGIPFKIRMLENMYKTVFLSREEAEAVLYVETVRKRNASNEEDADHDD